MSRASEKSSRRGGPLKRVLVSTPYDLAVPGGVNRQALDLAEALRRYAQCETLVIGPCSRADRMPDGVEPAGRVQRLPLNGATSNLSFDPFSWRRVLDIVRKFAPDIIHLHEPFTPMPSTALLFGTGLPKVGTFHTYSETSRAYHRTKLLFQPYARRLDARIAVSERARDFVSEVFPGEYHVVPNAIFLPKLDPTSPYFASTGPFRLLYVGRVEDPRKGFARMLEILRILDSRSPNRFHLDVVCHRPPQSPPPSDLPLSIHTGISDEALSRFYRNSDLLCAPSLGGESFGLVLLEALAHGLPIVAHDIRGYQELLGDGRGGILVDPGEAGLFAETVARMARSPDQRIDLGRNGRKKSEAYDWKRVVPTLLELYGACLHERPVNS